MQGHWVNEKGQVLETENKIETHRGAQLGVAALAVVSVAAGAFAWMNSGNSDAREMPSNNSETVEATARTGNDIVLPGMGDPAPKPRDLAPAAARVDAPDRVDPASPVPPKPDVPKDTTDPKPAPTRGVSNRLEKASFVVRIKGVEHVDQCLELYRKDKDAAEAAFMKWASTEPALDGLSFVSANYSGEVILSYKGDEDANPVTSAKELQKRITSVEGVRYADPDYTAHPGKGG